MRDLTQEMEDDRARERGGESGEEERARQERIRRRQELYARYREEVGISPVGACVSVIQSTFASGFLFSLAMLFFIFGASTILPDTLKAGTVDLLVSKPVDRLRIYLGKYVGGLLIIACNLLIFVGLTFLILTVKSGFVNWGYLLGGLMVLFAFAVLNAILHFFGVIARSAVFSILMGYAFYLIFDTGVETIHGLIEIDMLDVPGWLETAIHVLWLILPNFSSMKESAALMVAGVSIVDWTPIWTSGLFGVFILAWGYWIFRRKEF
jgi:ABC-type transport system involved in multi-copper enzyme maturation permease subunit